MSLRNKDGRMPVVVCGEGRVKQEFAKKSDINAIVARYQRSGAFDYVSRARPIFADVSRIGSFRDMVVKIRSAQEAFDSLPAVVRDRFKNDPSSLVEFMQDSRNRDEAIKLGLIEAPPKPVKPAVPASAEAPVKT